MSSITIEAARKMLQDEVLRSADANGLEAKHIREAQQRAEVLEHAANLKRQVAAVLTGAATLLPTDQIHPVGDLGMTVGMQYLAPADTSSYEELERYEALTERLFEVALSQMNRARDLMKAYRATLETGQIPEEFLPQPDPLTASPSESSGPNPVLPAPPAWPDLIGRRLALDIGETEPTVGRLIAVDPERLTVEVGSGAHEGETVRVDIAGVSDWQVLPEPQAAAVWPGPAGYPERPTVEAPEPLPRRERKADYAPVPLGEAAAQACGRALEGLRADEPEDERLVDPDCRDGKCDSCVGGPCEHECHQAQPDETGGSAADGRFQPADSADGPAGADRAGAVNSSERAGADGPAPGPARGDMTSDEQDGDGRG
jgi:hypothetical protein